MIMQLRCPIQGCQNHCCLVIRFALRVLSEVTRRDLLAGAFRNCGGPLAFRNCGGPLAFRNCGGPFRSCGGILVQRAHKREIGR